MVTDDGKTLSEALGLDAVIKGLADDLNDLRSGKITVNDARTRAELGKQIISGFRLVLNARKYLEERAREARALPTDNLEGDPNG